ncbi:54S ribosomal protein yml6, mitochondrial [Microbotryomycetes sp. JL201]|nr:54S ribosomal protein yml6, mitochondrial [Microbotryomycetes sp. JL201]
MSFVRRARILIPSCSTSSCSAAWTHPRAFATAAAADNGAPAATAAASTSAAAAASPSATGSNAVALPQTDAPTPFDPFVHVPLVSLTSASPLADPSTNEPLVVPLPSPLFNTPSRPSLLHRLVVAHLASLRQGTAASKNRSQVNYSGKKMRPQKGTGNARLGSRGSPMLKGGGHAFAKTPKGPDGWSLKVNRKEERLGLRVSLSDKWRQGRLNVVDRLAMPDASTRQLDQLLKRKGWQDSLFVVANGQDRDANQIAFELSSGNLEKTAIVSDIQDLGVWDIVKHKNVVIELDAVDELIYRLDPDLAEDLAMLDLAEEEEFDLMSATTADSTPVEQPGPVHA